MKALYLLLDLFSLSIPLIRSFEPKVQFNRQWKYLFPAILITGSFFIIWDIIFTHRGVWGFNPKYLTGIFLAGLPLEEWLFFLCIPYACVFTYVALNHFIKNDWLGPYARNITLVMVLVLSVVGLSHSDKAYTFTTFALTVIFLLLHLWVLKSEYLGRFYLAYAVILLPF
ncbi:MAG: lycopene cyclase domain-containing protein, partial [Cyclobacteriaceae bacterium]